MKKRSAHQQRSSGNRAASPKNPSLRWVVGHHAVREALQVRPQSVRELCFADEKSAQSGEWQKYLQKISVRPQQRSAGFFKDLSPFAHQGVAAALDDSPMWSLGERETEALLLLDGLEDPHNLGAIIRTAWLMGVGGIGITEHQSTKVTPTVAKVACGGCEHVAVEEMNFVATIEELKKENYWVYGFSEKATSTIYQTKFPERVVFVLGSEEKGLRAPVRSACDELLSIPQVSAEASYNVSVAAAIALAEYNRQTHWNNLNK